MTRESFPPLREWPSAGQTRTLLSVAVQAFGSRATQWHSWRRRLFRWAVLRCSLEGRSRSEALICSILISFCRHA